MPRSSNTFRISLIAILVMATLALFFTGRYVYDRYTGVLERVSEAAAPDYSLLEFERINNAVLTAEGNLQSFYLNGEKGHLQAFAENEKQIENGIENLAAHAKRSAVEEAYIARLDSVVNALLDIYTKRYLSPEDDRVAEALKELESKVNTQVATQSIRTDTIYSDSVIMAEKEKEKGFVKRLFGKVFGGKNASDSVAVDTVQKVTLKSVAQQPERLLEALSEQINALEKAKRAEFQQTKTKLQELTDQEKQLMSALLAIRNDLEAAQNQRVAAETQFAAQEINTTNRYIAFILVFIATLIFTAGYIVYRSVLQNRKYQAALQKTASEAEELAQTKSRFLANMSHELRTPLNAILGFTEQLQLSQGLPEKEKEQIHIIENASKHLLEVVNEVLDYTKLNSNTIRIKPVNFHVKEVCGDIHSVMERLAAKKNLYFNTELDPALPVQLRGDVYRVRQCLLNLAGNAIKFTEAGGVTLSVQYLGQKGQKHRLQFTVTDTGIGIEQADLERIFNEFEQLEDHERSLGGTGLGLPITKRLVSLMGGSLKVDSTVDQGTSIKIVLDFLEEQVPVVQRNTPAVPRLLIADDEPYNRKLLTAILDKYNISFEIASNGDEALALAQQAHFDAFLLDYRMPHKSGFDVMRELRQGYPQYANTPVFIVSAMEDVIDQSQVPEAFKPIQQIDKPVQEQALIDALRNYLNITYTNNKAQETTASDTLDMARIQQKVSPNAGFIAELLEEFNSSSKKHIKTMVSALNSQQWDIIAETAHQMAPSCKHLGFNACYQLLKKLEAAAENQWTKADYQKALGELKQRVIKVRGDVEAAIESLRQTHEA